MIGLGALWLLGRARSPLAKIAGGALGVSLVSRALAGHCAMKAALSGQSSFRQGMADQWSHTAATARSLGGKRARSAIQRIEKTVEVDRPLRTVYNQWTQFESFPAVSGAHNAGTVRFEPVGESRTRVRLVMAYQPEGAVESAGDALGLFEQQVKTSVEQFKNFIESRGVETGGWRGEVEDSRAH
jgi:uncharacterized membrane protein